MSDTNQQAQEYQRYRGHEPLFLQLSPAAAPDDPLQEKQRQVDYWGHRAERAEEARERMREALQEIMSLDDVRADEAPTIARRCLDDKRNDRFA